MGFRKNTRFKSKNFGCPGNYENWIINDPVNSFFKFDKVKLK